MKLTDDGTALRALSYPTSPGEAVTRARPQQEPEPEPVRRRERGFSIRVWQLVVVAASVVAIAAEFVLGVVR